MQGGDAEGSGSGERGPEEDSLPALAREPWWPLPRVLFPGSQNPFLGPGGRVGALLVHGLGKRDPVPSGTATHLLLRLGTDLAWHLAVLASHLLHVRPPRLPLPSALRVPDASLRCRQASL